MRVLITGGTGYLGQAIVRALLGRGHSPVVVTRGEKTSPAKMTSGVFSDPTPAEKTPDVISGPDVFFISGDVRDRDALVAAARGCDALIHSAALVTVWRPNPRDFDDVNVG